MISYNKGDVILVPFPFTDQTSIKKRPAVIISSGRYNRVCLDVVIMAITGQVDLNHERLMINDWKNAGLLVPSAIKPVISTLAQTLIIKKIGTFSTADFSIIQDAMGEIFND